MPTIARRMRHAFTLVEIAVVLIIIGLIAGAVLAGQSLIHGAEVNSVITDYTRFATASTNFRTKYFARPGDMINATQFWGWAGAGTTDCVSNAGITLASSPGTCDGNGNGIMDAGTHVSASSEDFRAWQHLALAGLIDGNYSGNSGVASAQDPDNGINTPPSKIAAAGWGYGYYDNSAGGNSYSFNYDMTNFLTLGNESDNIWPDGPALSAFDAENIDKKLDDGKPGRGFVIANSLSVANCTNYASTSDRDAIYRIDLKGINCSLVFKLPD